MSAVAKKTDPDLWDTVKAEITSADKGGPSGGWSARKAQLAVQEYKRRGGGYVGRKTSDNHLKAWEREDWGTGSGRPSGETGERYLPKEARDALTPAEYRRTSAKKKRDSKAGKRVSKQPAEIAAKTAEHRRS